MAGNLVHNLFIYQIAPAMEQQEISCKSWNPYNINHFKLEEPVFLNSNGFDIFYSRNPSDFNFKIPG